MPRYNGIIAYPFEVLLQLLWSYFVWGVLLTLAFMAIGLVLAQLTDQNDVGQMIASPEQVARQVGIATVLVFTTFRIFFQPRFHYAPALLTYVVAGAFGSLLLAAAWVFGFHFGTLAEIVDLPTWIALHLEEALRWLGWAVVAVGGCGLLSLFDYFAGSTRSVTLGDGRWLGRLLVGRAAYDAFVEREAARQGSEYDDYVKQIRNKNVRRLGGGRRWTVSASGRPS